MNTEAGNAGKQSSKERRNLRSTVLWVLLAIISFPLVLMGIQIDDWQRDFSINWAKTAADAKDPLLKPVLLPGNVADAKQLILEVVSKLNRWKASVGSAESIEGDAVVVRFERTTGLMRLVDDITVRLLPQANAVLVEVESRSRVGKADLGQNPRNIKELNAAIQAAVKQQG